MEAPVEPYITHDELANCCEAVDTESAGDDPVDTLWSRTVASSFLFYALGQQYPGQSTVYIRPAWECSPCYDRPLATLIDGKMYNLRCDRTYCGCSARSRITLTGRDIASIDDVIFAGTSLAASDYYVLGRNTIVLRAGLQFPLCQEWGNPAFPTLTPAADYTDTWGIEATVGVTVPSIVKQAAVDLACHYQNVCQTPCNTCKFAVGFSTNDGNIDLAFQGVLPHVFTGIFSVDSAIKALNPYGFGRVKARIWSPEAAREVVEYGG